MTADRIPDSLGGYEILGKLGEGGMGVVYAALQASPRRRVALKVMRVGGAGGAERLRHHEREVAALGRLRHDGIASIYDAGVTSEGLPFFVMELVEGRPLTDALAAGGAAAPHTRADIAFRLALFLEIADAIEYAHQRGVIHRDLKPANVLVRSLGPGGVAAAHGSRAKTAAARVKVLDFGLARLTDEASFSGDAGVVQGTLPYMSPEQVQGRPEDVGASSDVYALGVMLYEMLTGELPYEVRSASVTEAVRLIVEKTPRRPSDVLPQLRGDLEAIVLRALEKDPGDRYATASAMADDIRRYLDGLPVAARMPGAWEQMRRIAARHRVVTTLAGLLVVVVVAGIASTTHALVRARSAEHAARSEAERAQREQAGSEEVSSFLEDLFVVANPGEERGKTITARELLDRGVERIEGRFADQPAERARLLGTMGGVYQRLGLYRDSRPPLEEAMRLRESAPGIDSLDLARSQTSLAALLRRQGDYPRAEDLYHRSLATRERRLPPGSIDIAANRSGLAGVLFEMGRPDEARALHERAIAAVESARGPDHADLAPFLAQYAAFLQRLGEVPESIPIFERVAAIREKAKGPRDPDLARDLSSLAFAYAENGDLSRARAIHERALDIRIAVYGPENIEVSEALMGTGSMFIRAGEPLEAAKHLRRALEIATRVLGPTHARVGAIEDNLSMALRNGGDLEGALDMSHRAIATMENALGPDHINLAFALIHLAGIHRLQGDLASARSSYDRALAIQERVNGPSSRPVVETCLSIASLELEKGSRARSKRFYDRVLEIVDGGTPMAPDRVAELLDQCADLAGRSARAESLRTRAKALRDSLHIPAS